MTTLTPYVVPTAHVVAARSARLDYPGLIASAAGQVGIPYRLACALIEQESGGANVYGRHDGIGAALSGFPDEVDRSNYRVFLWLVLNQGRTSNGVGPAQITYRGYHQDALDRDIPLWQPSENIRYAFARILAPSYVASGSWRQALAEYNGGPEPGPHAFEYAAEVMDRARVWAQRLAEADA